MSRRSSLSRISWDRRNVELLLVLVALAVSWLGLFQLDAAMGVANSVEPVKLLLIVGAALTGHLMIRIRVRAADPFIYPVALCLNLLGLLMIHRLDLTARARLSAGEVFQAEADSQMFWLVLGIAMATVVVILLRDHRHLQRYTFTSMALGIGLLLLPMLPFIGVTLNGARLWIRIGPLSFQPAEISKLLLAIFFAGYLARHRNSLSAIKNRWLGLGFPRPREVGPLLFAWGLSIAVLIVQRDLGTSLLFFGLFVGLLYMATGERTWLALGFIMFAAGATTAYFLFSHVHLRVAVWLDPFQYANDEGFQIAQSLYGFASGGIFGRGLGQGFSWLVPYAQSDFIFTAFGEELGYTGITVVVLLYAILIQRMVRLGLAARDDFGKLLAIGLALVLALQVFVVLGGVSRLIPMTGLVAPFLAAGGSALIANWVMIGVLLRISDTTAKLNLPAGEGV